MARLINRLLVIERRGIARSRPPGAGRRARDALLSSTSAGRARPTATAAGPLAGGRITADADQLNARPRRARRERRPAHRSRRRDLRVRAGRLGDRLQIRVRDGGTWIPPAALQRIFDRFYRIDRSRNRRLGGSGLGLSIVRAVAQAHGGGVHAHTPAVAVPSSSSRCPGCDQQRLQPVAAATDRLDGDVGLQLAPQPANGDVHDVRTGGRTGSPRRRSGSAPVTPARPASAGDIRAARTRAPRGARACRRAG